MACLLVALTGCSAGSDVVDVVDEPRTASLHGTWRSESGVERPASIQIEQRALSAKLTVALEGHVCLAESTLDAELSLGGVKTTGNHEYQTTSAAGYYAYFGERAGDPAKGYYSLDIGRWHVLALNTNDNCRRVACGEGSEQLAWLRADLEQHKSTKCTVALFHHPRWSALPLGVRLLVGVPADRRDDEPLRGQGPRPLPLKPYKNWQAR